MVSTGLSAKRYQMVPDGGFGTGGAISAIPYRDGTWHLAPVLAPEVPNGFWHLNRPEIP